ncbi:hypothetical protein GF351_02770 [Candidatus Woesearchaeota archaeon]|nr:hypothetical protein [Candidatus Woesearchaeota archaeon]
MKNVTVFIGIALLVLVFMSGCKQAGSEEEAERTAQKLGLSFQNKEYGDAYVLFTQDLKDKKDSAEFVTYLETLEPDSYPIFDKVVMDTDTTAYAYYKDSESGENIPPVKMVWAEDRWRIDGFKDFFEQSCMENCSDDGDECTEEVCDASTEYLCEHRPIPGCAHEGDSCNISADCGEDMDCIDGSCLVVECYEDTDCGGDKICYDYVCLEDIPCSKNADCPDEQPYCRDGYCKKDQCKDDDDCPTSIPYCLDNSCYMTECLDDSHCEWKEDECEDHCETADGVLVDVYCSSSGDCRCDCDLL